MKYPPQLPHDFNLKLPMPEVGQPASARWIDFDSSEGSEVSKLLEYARILRRHKGTILIAAVLGILSGYLFSRFQTPLYRSRASIELRLPHQSFNGVSTNDPLADVQTQVKLLQSGSLRERVVRKLRLAEVQGSAGRNRGLELGRTAGALQVNAQPGSRVIEISCSSTDPQLAADFINTLAEEFLEQHLENRWVTYQRTGEWLNRAQEDIRTKLEKSEKNLQEYARASGLIYTSERDSVAEEKLKQLQQELSRAQGDRVAKQSSYELTVSSPHESLPEVLDNGPLREYQVRLADLRRQLAELSSSLTPAHYKVVRIQAQINELESTMTKERSNVIKRIRNEYQSAVGRENLLTDAYVAQAKLVTGQAEKAIQYNLLKREVDTNRQLYEATMQKGKEASIESALRDSNMRIADPAKRAFAPYKPDLIFNVVAGFFGGTILGVFCVLIRAFVDHSINTPGESPYYLNVPELGVIPSSSADPSRQIFGRQHRLILGSSTPQLGEQASAIGNSKPSLDGTHKKDECVELVTWQRKPSLLAESFRATMASILFSGQNGGTPRVIAITSCVPMEGKTSVICNLGIALAEINQRVLLIDGDLRRPRLHSVFRLGTGGGLSELLRDPNPIEKSPIDTLVRETQIPGLYVLPGGSRTIRISNLLYSARMPQLLRHFRQQFDTVLVDTPPMLHLSDARLISRLVDGVILVIRAGKTSRDNVMAAVQRLHEDGTPVLGTVLNDWNPRKAGYRSYDLLYSHYYGSGKTA